MSSFSHQHDLSISLRTAHERGHARRRCYWIEAGGALYCTTVVSKRSSDIVSGDVEFRRPAVELLVVTMHSWAQPCHTKRVTRPEEQPNLSIVRGVMAFFLISPTLHLALTAFFFFLRSPGEIVGVDQ